MYNLEATAREMMLKLDAINIPYRKPNIIRVNNRFTRKWGVCILKSDGRVIVEVNKILLDERSPRKGLEETILHELLHTCKGCANHGTLWKGYVARVNKVWGYNIQTRDSSEDKQIAQAVLEERKEKALYVLECQKCGYRFYKNRMSNMIMYPERYEHKNCIGSRLRLIENRSNNVIMKPIWER